MKSQFMNKIQQQIQNTTDSLTQMELWDQKHIKNRQIKQNTGISTSIPNTKLNTKRSYTETINISSCSSLSGNDTQDIPSINKKNITNIQTPKSCKTEQKNSKTRSVSSSSSASSEISNGYEYEVEKILDSKVSSKGKFYLVKWKGWEITQSSWEPKDNLENVIEMVEEYEAQRKQLDEKNNNISKDKIVNGEEKKKKNKLDFEQQSKNEQYNPFVKQITSFSQFAKSQEKSNCLSRDISTSTNSSKNFQRSQKDEKLTKYGFFMQNNISNKFKEQKGLMKQQKKDNNRYGKEQPEYYQDRVLGDKKDRDQGIKKFLESEDEEANEQEQQEQKYENGDFEEEEDDNDTNFKIQINFPKTKSSKNLMYSNSFQNTDLFRKDNSSKYYQKNRQNKNRSEDKNIGCKESNKFMIQESTNNEETIEYVFESIIDKRELHKGQIEYLVKFENISEPSWEPISNLESIQSDILYFEKQIKQKKKNITKRNRSQLLFGIDKSSQNGKSSSNDMIVEDIDQEINEYINKELLSESERCQNLQNTEKLYITANDNDNDDCFEKTPELDRGNSNKSKSSQGDIDIEEFEELYDRNEGKIQQEEQDQDQGQVNNNEQLQLDNNQGTQDMQQLQQNINVVTNQSDNTEVGCYLKGDTSVSVKLSDNSNQSDLQVGQFVVQWKQRQNGITPNKAIISYQMMKQLDPLGLIGFYESIYSMKKNQESCRKDELNEEKSLKEQDQKKEDRQSEELMVQKQQGNEQLQLERNQDSGNDDNGNRCEIQQQQIDILTEISAESN